MLTTKAHVRRRVASARTARGLTLIELLIALTITLTLIGASVALSMQVRASVRSGALLQATSRIVTATRQLQQGEASIGYAGITAAGLHARSSALDDLFYLTGTTGEFRAAGVSIVLADSPYYRTGTGAAAGLAGDGFALSFAPLEPEACTDLLQAHAGDATAAVVGSTPVLVGEQATIAQISAACATPEASTTTLHFN